MECFKPFKTTFKKIRNRWSLGNKTKVVDKQTLYEWTSKSLKEALMPKNIRSRFRASGTWPLDYLAARHDMKPLEGFEHADGLDRRAAIGSASFGDGLVPAAPINSTWAGKR